MEKLNLKELVKIAQSAEELGDANGLYQAAEQLLLRDPNNAEYILYKLKALDMVGKVTSDLGLIQHYVRMRSSDVTGFLLLYKAYVSNGYIAEGLIALSFALSIEPDDQECQQLMTNLLAEVDERYTHVKINILTIDRIGHLACEIEPFARKHQDNEGCLYLFISPGVQPANPYLFELLKNVAHVIDSPFYYHLYHTRSLLLDEDYYAKLPYDLQSSQRGIEPMDVNIDGYRNLIDIYQKYPQIMRIPEEDAEFGWQYLSSFGITKSDKIVLLHVRDSAYLKKKYPKNDFSYHDFRDADITNYQEAVEELIVKGYKVVRIGSDTDQQLAINHTNYIDLCVNKAEQHGDFYEVFLISVCEFFIATTSGPMSIAAMFETPTLCINSVPFHPPYFNNSRFIPKRLMQNGEEVSLLEVCRGKVLSDEVDTPILFTFVGSDLEKLNYEYIENSPTEITEAVLEFSLQVNERQFENTRTELQQAYVDALPEDFIYKNCQTIVCDSFLQRHPDIFK